MPGKDKTFDLSVSGKTEVIALGWWGVADGNDEQNRQQLMDGVANLPNDTVHLDLSANQFGFCELTYLLKLMEAIKPQITALNLSFNQCGNMSADDLACLFNHIPGSVVALNLSHNNLSHYAIDEWLAIINALPKSVVSVDLSYNLPVESEMLIMDALEQALRVDKKSCRVKLFSVRRSNHYEVHGCSPKDGLDH
ncbi:leucine-rich repeat domain-containing protein [Legionella spiritensis]|uniref:Leucine-rich repeat protein n=1 Tax=Legionella spiritensis TaxID=452 RepID=A0A0W0Z9D3_LEGSP|nr:hypothetical protein [Legionella spiritensis]KTD65657.1 Leucine-rich repeat protein [Legionella spiritensis]SNV43709.1 Leucine-rich repeat protein [Legionella spiritensis]VEG90684.1 Leucine-rich repeat protein [Legionella spiritensis]